MKSNRKTLKAFETPTMEEVYSHLFSEVGSDIKLSEADVKIRMKVEDIYTDLVIISEMLRKSENKEFIIDTYFAEVKFKVRKEAKNEKN